MEERQRGINAFTLKWIAAVAMLCSHMYRSLLFPNKAFLFFDLIGRIAFPIFCFLLVEGFCHTKNRRVYLMRLWVFAVFSEIPFDLAFRGKLFSWDGQNVLFALFIGFLVLWGIEKVGPKWCLVPLFSGMVGAYFLRVDYSFYGIWLIAVFYFLRGMKKEMLYLQAGSQAFSIFLYGWIQIFSLFSLPFLALYNGERGRGFKYFFYIFYPLHLIILVLIHLLISNLL